MRMPDALIAPSLAVIGFGLLASLGWGVADFGGGLVSRREPVLGVLLGSQFASVTVAVPILALSHEPAMRPVDGLIATGGGLFGAVGLALLYRGLSVGRMGVVAPVAAVLTAALPVGFGFLTQGLPSVLGIAGIGCAALSVVLVSRVPGATDGRPSGLWYGLAAGAIFGLFTITVSRLGPGLLISPVVLIRGISCTFLVGWILVRNQPWRVTRRFWPALFAIGVLDGAATVAYLAAIAAGPLAIAAIIASLYPVVTTILAATVLRERITRVHAVGIGVAGLAVTLIAGATGA